MNEVCNIISTAISEKRILDRMDIYNITSIIIKLYDCDKYLDNIVISDYFVPNIAEYSVYNKVISFNPRNMLNDSISFCNNRHYSLDFNTKILFQIFYQLVIILHEIRHVIQNKMISSQTINNTNDYVYKMIMFDCIRGDLNETYKRNGNLFPSEKDANFFAVNFVFNLFKTMPINNAYFHSILNDAYFYYLYQGYNNYFGILRTFYCNVLSKENVYKHLSKYLNELTTYNKLGINANLNEGDVRLLNEFFQNVNNSDPIVVLNKKI